MGITNNFQNFEFDILVFDVVDGTSADLECYKQAVYDANWQKDCGLEKSKVTHLFTHVQLQSHAIKSGEEENDKDRVVILDNTPFPRGGAYANSAIVLEYSSSSSFRMSYDLRATSIYMGIVSTVLCFAIGMLAYLTVKVRRDIARKFGDDDEDEDEGEEGEEEEEQEDKEEIDLFKKDKKEDADN